jgi:hypothetical protein
MSLVENKVYLTENFNHKMPHLNKRKQNPPFILDKSILTCDLVIIFH